MDFFFGVIIIAQCTGAHICNVHMCILYIFKALACIRFSKELMHMK
jgi:hypothetical protein